jgi:2-polyprenyl-3-methyl-5-hydroxy-6-metoxy-1,4-benzoquinol methylase
MMMRPSNEEGAGESRPLSRTPVYFTHVSDRFLESVPCNICGSVESHILQPAQYDVEALQDTDFTRTFSSSSDERLRHQLLACTRCGLQYVSPRLRSEAVLGGYTDGSDEQFVSQARGREITFGKSLDEIESIWNRERGRLLDIGTGGGSFPYMAAARGWQAEGCEPNRWLCEWALQNYKLPIRPGTVFEQHYPAKSFDVVTLWDVLEHTPDPKAEVQEMHRLLKDEGLVVINYPDIGSWIARAMGRSWVFLLDVHLYYFTRATIRRLLEDTGFDVIRIRPHFQRLSLGYILRRAMPYAGAPARIAERVLRLIGIAGWQAPYWMGQTLVIARKRPTIN